jgi:hypothetical protein
MMLPADPGKAGIPAPGQGRAACFQCQDARKRKKERILLRYSARIGGLLQKSLGKRILEAPLASRCFLSSITAKHPRTN